jgi:hypothetical protein
MKDEMRPYQSEIGNAVLKSVRNQLGLTFTVEIARQGGKNEVSARLGAQLLSDYMGRGGNLVKAAPTFAPQAKISIDRLKGRLRAIGLDGVWRMESGYVVRLGQARQVFLSAQPSANVVGNTAHLLLEMDEAQGVDKDKYYKEFRPMAASTNATTVLYGIPWDGTTLLEETKEQNLELERKDGVKRHFSFPWEAVAQYNVHYKEYVDGERQRMGEDHPAFRTQYLLLPTAGRSGLFSSTQQAQLQGRHPRQHTSSPGGAYVAGLDLAGGAPEGEAAPPRQDSTVLTIGEMDFSGTDESAQGPVINVVEHVVWRGTPHHQITPQLVDLLKKVWRCRRVAVDATGLGEGVASYLTKHLGRLMTEPVKFTLLMKSKLGYEMMGAVNSGRLKMYARDGSEEWTEFWRQVGSARARYRQNEVMDFYVDPSQGHDDFLSSLALLVEAGRYLPRVAKGR